MNRLPIHCDDTMLTIKPVQGTTARKALGHVAATFVESHRPSPIADPRGNTHNHIERQTKGYKRSDPSTKHEKALPPIVFEHILMMAILPREVARATLICAALFFAMRSFEYTYVGTGERKTRPIRACDIIFRNGAKVVGHDDPHLHLSGTVSIDFGEQKSELKDETVTQDNNNDTDLNPVILYSSIIHRLRSYPNYSDKWPIFTFHDGDKFIKISLREILQEVRTAVDSIGIDELGFTSADVGTHSIRASLAMTMYLAKEPIYTIMLIGRWSSDAFLAYIEKQIKEFTKGVSTRMLLNKTFYNTPLARNSQPSSTQHQGLSHRRQAHSSVFGRQAGSLRHQLRPQN